MMIKLRPLRKSPRRLVAPPPGCSPVRVPYNMMNLEVCPEHHEYGPIQRCPFPGCSNGLPQADEWIVVDMLMGDKVFQRTPWDLGDGHCAWSWEDDDGLYLSVRRVFWSEARRRQLQPVFRSTPRVYQYTTPEGFLGMLRSNELWLSDYAYLNDATELTHGIERARDVFSHVGKLRPISRKVLDAQSAPDLSDYKVCVASFSTEADSLSQWRAYGPVAVGFDIDHLAFGNSHAVTIGPVIYELKAQDEMLRLIANLVATAWENERPSEKRRLRNLYANPPERLLDLIAFFKNSGFSDERELRMIYTESSTTWRSFGLNPTEDKFRVSNGLVVPYVTTRDIYSDHPERLPVREVVVGPGPKSVELKRGVERALIAYGYRVPVRISGVTYRQ
jgi:hypothetical protein